MFPRLGQLLFSVNNINKFRARISPYLKLLNGFNAHERHVLRLRLDQRLQIGQPLLRNLRPQRRSAQFKHGQLHLPDGSAINPAQFAQRLRINHGVAQVGTARAGPVASSFDEVVIRIIHHASDLHPVAVVVFTVVVGCITCRRQPEDLNQPVIKPRVRLPYLILKVREVTLITPQAIQRAVRAH